MTDQVEQPGQAEQAGSPQEIKPKQQFEGKVTKIELYGAFIDIGTGQDGWLHISRLREEPVNRVSDVLAEGQPVMVWVHRVDPRSNRVDLTMIRPLAVGWNELKRDQVYSGTVTRVEKFGVFVDIGAERPGLVHVSEMARGYVGDPSEMAKVGDQVEVKVKDFDRRKRRIDLSMKDTTKQEVIEEDETREEAMPTAMEIALREAMAGAQKTGRGGGGGKRERSDRREQEDILQRTLQQRGNRR